MQQPHRAWSFSATIMLLILNIVAYIFQTKLLPGFMDESYLELSLEGLRQGYVWQLLTYQFLHGGWAHLLLNCWALFVFGRGVEWAIGNTRFLVLYLCSGVIGGLLQVLVSLLWPDYFGGAAVGASAGVFGVV